MRVVAQGVHGEVDLLRVRLQARRDGVEPGLELAEELDELVRRETQLRRIEQEVDDLAPIEILVEFRADVGIEQVAQEGVGGITLGDRQQELFVRRADLVVADQRQANRLF